MKLPRYYGDSQRRGDVDWPVLAVLVGSVLIAVILLVGAFWLIDHYIWKIR